MAASTVLIVRPDRLQAHVIGLSGGNRLRPESVELDAAWPIPQRLRWWGPRCQSDPSSPPVSAHLGAVVDRNVNALTELPKSGSGTLSSARGSKRRKEPPARETTDSPPATKKNPLEATGSCSVRITSPVAVSMSEDSTHCNE